MKQLLALVLFVLIACGASPKQEVTPEKPVQDKQFPDAYLGIYKGDLKISNPNGSQTLPMEFHLLQTDSTGVYNYTIVYGEGELKQTRAYKLLTVNKATGEYVVDEDNGILLDAKWVENTLYFSFEVQDNLLTTTERFYDNAMDFEITFSSKKNKKQTGSEQLPVISYPITVVQKAHLVKQSQE